MQANSILHAHLLQIEAVKLAAESQRRHLEATLANAKRDAAQATSAHKLAAATWQAECSTHEKEVSAACGQHG